MGEVERRESEKCDFDDEGGRRARLTANVAGRCVEREKLTESYLQTELEWNEESKKRKLEEDMKPIVLDAAMTSLTEREGERKREEEKRQRGEE